jgi:uncharacterized membrane protein YbhN (UPF0104 family)
MSEPPEGTLFPTPAPGRTAVRAGWLAGALLLLALLAVTTRLGEGRRFAALLQQARPLWLLAAVVLQAATYVCAAAVWERALHRGGAPRRLLGLVPLGLAKLFADQALPSAGMSGTVLVAGALRRRGVPRGLAVGAMLAGLVSFYVAYALAVAVALATLWWRGELHRLLVGLGAVFAALAAGVPLAIFWLRGRASRHLPAWIRRLPYAREAWSAMAEAPPGAIFGPILAVETVALQLGIFALDAATLEVMLQALATPAAADVVFASFVVASLVATLAWVPGGLGTFEATCVAMLRLHGVTLEASVAATLLLRGFTFWLPMAPGLWIAHHEMVRPPAATQNEAQR